MCEIAKAIDIFAFKTAKSVKFCQFYSYFFETAKAISFQIAFVNDIYN